MALSAEQRDVFLLAVEKLETDGSKAMDHAGHTQVQSSSKSGRAPVIDWAVDYLGCLPANKEMAELVVRAHSPDAGEWTRQDIRRCGGACRGFYIRVQKRGLFATGVRYLRMLVG